MFELVELSGGEAAEYLEFTFPAYRSQLISLEKRSSAVAVGARAGGFPSGLALASHSPGGSTASVLSVYVLPFYRGRGLAKKLLERLEDELAARGCRDVDATFVTGGETTTALRRVLRARGWDEPAARLRIMTGDIRRIAEAPLLRLLEGNRLPPGDVFDWHALGWLERKRYQRQLRSETWVAADINPFAPDPLGAQVEPLNSLGLRIEGRLAGWMITHRIQRDTIRYSRWCIEPGLAGGIGAGWLLAEAIRRQVADGAVERGSWAARVDNESMRRFIDKRLAPWVGSDQTSYRARKALYATAAA